jgi:hypothetical protein
MKMEIPQEIYAQATLQSRQRMAKALTDPKVRDLVKKARSIAPEKWSLDDPIVKAAGRALVKAGVTTSLGFNFYDLRGPAYMIFPLLTPFIQSIPKAGKVNAGVGLAANWKATRNPNSTYVYPGVLEGQRGGVGTPNQVPYLATYKELGQEGSETFTAQWAGEGFTDNQADEHFRNLARLRLGEEMMTIWGNSGNTVAGNLGFSLGQPATPTVTLTTGSGLANSSNVVVAVVAITGFGMNPGGQAGYAAPPSVSGGLTPSYTRTNADGTTMNVSCGLSQISNVAAIVTANATAGKFTCTVPAIKGAVAYAWFWGVNVTAAAGNVKLGAITAWPTYVISAVAAGTQLGNAAGLSTDNSFQPTDFDGLATYSFLNGTWTDMNGGSFTPAGNGMIQELENDLQTMWNNYQAQPDNIYVSADVRQALEQAAMYSSTGTNSFIFASLNGQQTNGLDAGFVITGYKSKYSINATGGTVIPIRLHPQMPAGTMIYDINQNPYPHSRMPAVRQFLLQRDYYAIEWPVTTRSWGFGTYIHEVLAHYCPWITAIRTGIGPFVAPCWIAAVVFHEDFHQGPRVQIVRRFLLNWESKSVVGKLVVGLYRMHGQAVAEVTKKSSLLKKAFGKLFGYVLSKAGESA